MSRHLPRLLLIATKVHALRPINAVLESQSQSSAEREHRSIVHVAHYFGSPQGLRVPYPTAAKSDIVHVLIH